MRKYRSHTGFCSSKRCYRVCMVLITVSSDYFSLEWLRFKMRRSSPIVSRFLTYQFTLAELPKSPLSQRIFCNTFLLNNVRAGCRCLSLKRACVYMKEGRLIPRAAHVGNTCVAHLYTRVLYLREHTIICILQKWRTQKL